MKKLSLTFLTLLSCNSSFALPVGNPSEASLLTDGIYWCGIDADFCDPNYGFFDGLSIKTGFYGDYIENRFLKVRRGDNKGRLIDDTSMSTNALYLAANLWNCFDLFSSLGYSNVYLHTNAPFFGLMADRRVELQTRSGFSWSMGIRSTLWESECASIGFESQYFFTRPDISRVTIGTESQYLDTRGWTFKYEEWQVGFGLSYRICQTIPYLAIKWSHVNVDPSFDKNFWINNQLITPPFLENRSSIGLAVGVTLMRCSNMLVTAEYRFPDERAFYVNAIFRI